QSRRGSGRRAAGPGRQFRTLPVVRHSLRPVSDDPHGLRRFVDAQEDSAIYARALGELRAGRKQSHWIWFVFPQIAGLGQSPMPRAYAIRSLDEARAYPAHPLLSPRLHECAEALLAADPTLSADQILGGIDALKLRSSMILFTRAAPRRPPLPHRPRPLFQRGTRPRNRPPPPTLTRAAHRPQS